MLGLPERAVRLGFRATVGAALLSAGCAGILGIDDGPGLGGSGGQGNGTGGNLAGTGGNLAGAGGASATGGKPLAGSGGDDGASANAGAGPHSEEAGSGGAGEGGEQSGGSSAGDVGSLGGEAASSANGGDAGASTGGSAGDTGGEGDGGRSGVPISVEGRVVDAFGVPLAGLDVEIDGQDVVTDAAGQFRAEGVIAPYDVSFVVTERSDASVNLSTTDAWVFSDVSRTDPTFFVARAGEVYESTLGFFHAGLGSAAPSIELGTVLEGRVHDNDLGVYGAYISLDWRGPRAAQGVAHVIALEKDEHGVPARYLSYGERSIVADSAQYWGAEYTFDLTPADTFPTASVSVSVAATQLPNRMHELWLHFEDGARLCLAKHEATAESVDYDVPVIPGASVIVVARAGGLYPGRSAVVHRHASASLDLALPEPPRLTAPDPGSVRDDTVYRWETSAPLSKLTLTQYETQHRLHIVTAGTSAHIPPALLARQFVAGPLDVWVETFDSIDGMDAATSADGFLDPFDGQTRASRISDGSFAMSEVRGVALELPAE